MLSLHFTGMSAVKIIPDPSLAITALALSPHALSIAAASTAAARLGLATFFTPGSHRHLAKIAIASIPQGICMYDCNQRVVVRNHRYAEMYGLTLDETKPGVTMRDILESRVAEGVYRKIQGEDFVEANLAKWNQEETNESLMLHCSKSRVARP